MCPHCGSLWSTVNYKIRIVPGKPIANSVKKHIRSMNNNSNSVPKVRASLIKKCKKYQSNRLSIKCSVCSRRTVIPLTKPKREKIKELENNNTVNSQRKRKKRTKDKTAGLNISRTVHFCKENDERKKERIVNKIGANTSNFITSTPKLKKLNIARLKDIVTQGTSAPKTKSLHKFLTEL